MGFLENIEGEIFMGKRVVLKINKQRCKGCFLCLEVCPQKNLSISKSFNKFGYHFVEINKEDNCTGCKKCAIICPEAAIEIFIDEQQTKKQEVEK